MQYRLSPSPNVCARSFGDEVVAANFVKGVYYSLMGSAAQIWEGLMAGHPLPQVVEQVAALSHSATSAEFAATAEYLVDALISEGLLVPATDIEATAWQPMAGPDGPYGLPVLERFTDMEDLLLLDPIHDVEEMGWPHVGPAAVR